LSDAGNVKLKKPANLSGQGGEEMKLPASVILRSQFAALTRPQAERLTTATSGVLTRDGDFLEGDVKSLQSGSATVSSVAFGLTTMDRWRVVAVALPAPAPTRIETGLTDVRLQDGSIIAARKLTVDKEQLVIEEPILGTLRVAIKDVVSLERRAN
jgi:hypothetical protein